MKETFEKIIKKLKKTWNIEFPILTTPLIKLEDAIKAVEQVAAEYNNGWIPVEERLPEENTDVIAYLAHGTVEEVYFGDGMFHGVYEYAMKGVIAWQPLPEPYQRGESEKRRYDCDMNCRHCEHQAECDEFSL